VAHRRKRVVAAHAAGVGTLTARSRGHMAG
jgi:hypothetical protein